MSMIGGGLENALAQVAQAQQSVAKDKDRERAASESSRRISDSVRLRVAAVEEADAVRDPGHEGHDSGNRKRDQGDSDGPKDESRRDDGADHVGVDLTV
jgi:hypothetical protein